jgi:hypothetical protein
VRLHALHVQGLDAPRGKQRVPIHSGYSLLFGPKGDLLGVRDLLLALLYPEAAFEGLKARRDSEAGEASRAVLTLQLGTKVYRIGADLDGQRIALARFDPKDEKFSRICADGESADRQLRALGRPDRSLLETLQFLGLDHSSPPRLDPEGPPARGVPSVEQETPSPPRAEVEPPQARLALEREEEQLVAELGKLSALSQSEEDLEVAIERYRALREECTRDLESVERTRESLLGGRARIQRVPARQTPWIRVGLGLGVSGALAGYFADPLAYGLGILGGGVALNSTFLFRGARRRLGRLDARLAALRVREATLERRFEENAEPVRTLLVALGMGGVDQLEEAVRRGRELTARLAAVRSELGEAREGSSEGEATSSAPDPPVPDEVIAPPPLEEVRSPQADPEATIPDSDPLDEGPIPRLLQLAAAWSGAAVGDLRTQLQACLPLYLRAVSDGRLREMMPIGGRVWGVVRGEGSAVPREALSEAERRQADVAFQLALLERIAPAGRLPLIVGPSAAQIGNPAGLARALARLARVVQVVQFAESDVPWSQFAAQAHPLA